MRLVIVLALASAPAHAARLASAQPARSANRPEPAMPVD